MLARHSLVWLDRAGWLEANAFAAAKSRDAIARWQQADWPLIVRRRDADATDSTCCLGLATPPDPVTGDKTRICLRASIENVSRVSAPLPIPRVIKVAPALWQKPLASLHEKADAIGMSIRVYGSLALQALTGASYLTPRSDVDLLLYPQHEDQLSAGMQLLGEAAGHAPIDGEIIFPSGHAVAWKEWAAATQEQTGIRVLTKHLDTVRLTTTTELLATLKGNR